MPQPFRARALPALRASCLPLISFSAPCSLVLGRLGGGCYSCGLLAAEATGEVLWLRPARELARGRLRGEMGKAGVGPLAG